MAVTAAPNHFSVSMSWELCKDLKREAKPEAGALVSAIRRFLRLLMWPWAGRTLGLSFWEGRQLASDPDLSLCTLVPSGGWQDSEPKAREAPTAYSSRTGHKEEDLQVYPPYNPTYKPIFLEREVRGTSKNPIKVSENNVSPFEK